MKVYKVRRKDSGEFFAVKYLHKRKMKDIDDSEVKILIICLIFKLSEAHFLASQKSLKNKRQKIFNFINIQLLFLISSAILQTKKYLLK